MTSKIIGRLSKTLCIIVTGIIAFGSCIEEQHPGTYYTFSGHTVASRLEERSEDFSEFIKVLKKAGMWTEMSTYGEHTCFAPYNSAIEDFLVSQGKKDNTIYNSVEELPKEVSDSLARMHLVGTTCFVGEMSEGSFPSVNMLDRFIMLSFNSKKNASDTTTTSLQLCINKFSHIVEKDDTCENGVIHTIDQCIDFTGDFVYDRIDENEDLSIFAQALKLTGFKDSILNMYEDESYEISQDLVLGNGLHLHASTRDYKLLYWESRKIRYTIFVEPDYVFNEHNISDIDGLIAYAKNVYDEAYPTDSTISDFKDPRNSLNRFVAYHILPEEMEYRDFNIRFDVMDLFQKINDSEDYFSTLAPSSIMRISTDMSSAKREVFINRQGKEGNGSTVFNGGFTRGIRIIPAGEIASVRQDATNGYIHYIDDILVYDTNVRENILDRRLRIDCGTMSPDFINSRARHAISISDEVSTGFLNPMNYHAYNKDYRIHIRPIKEAKTNSETGTNTYEGDAVDIEGRFDMYVKLPAVPHDGTWQIRLSFRALSQCGVVQFYLSQQPSNFDGTIDMNKWEPLGIPVDMRIELSDPTVGWIEDSDLKKDEIDALDKAMKNRGWMKGPDSHWTQNSQPHRDEEHQGRFIISTAYMTSNADYYLRFKQLLEDDNAQFCLDYIELVPKSVYDNYEDKH